MRVPPLLALAVLLVAGCAAPEPRDEPDALLVVAIDGRFGFDAERARELADAALADLASDARFAGGRAWLADARALDASGRAVASLSLAALDEDARASDDALLAAVPRLPARGELLLSRAVAERAGLAAGAEVTLASHAWSVPALTSGFEMERLLPCDDPNAYRFCTPEPGGAEAVIRFALPEGATDLAFLPDVVELGPEFLPAWWNGTFTAPDGARHAIRAFAGSQTGPFEDTRLPGRASAGTWEIRFTLDANGTRIAGGTAGRVIVREPGYTWFDDVAQGLRDAGAQSALLAAGARDTRATLRVAGTLEAGFDLADALVHPADAATLRGDAPANASALLLRWPGFAGDAEQRKTFRDALEERTRKAIAPSLFALSPRFPGSSPEGAPLAGDPRAPSLAPDARALLAAAPRGVDVAALPAIDGALTPSLALAARAPLAANATLAGKPLASDALFLAPARAGEAFPWSLAPGGRWPTVEETATGLAEYPILAVASVDVPRAAGLDAQSAAFKQVALAGVVPTRTRVLAGVSEDAPPATIWVGGASLQNVGSFAGWKLVVPLAEGATRDEVARAIDAAWGPLGVVVER